MDLNNFNILNLCESYVNDIDLILQKVELNDDDKKYYHNLKNLVYKFEKAMATS